MILSDRDLHDAIKKRRLVFSPPLDAAAIGPASIDLKLSQEFKTFSSSKLYFLDPKNGLPKDFMDTQVAPNDEPFILHPSSFVLASTKEAITVPDDMVVCVEGKSTLARMGVLVHTAGFIDPGFSGNITLEISNQSNIAIALYPGMYICQIAVHRTSSPAKIPYNKRKKSAYKNQKGVTEARPKNLFDR